MGLFLETAVLPRCTKEQAQSAVRMAAEANDEFCIKLSECHFVEQKNGTSIVFNEGIVGFDGLAEMLSATVGGRVLYLYIYDEDFWGYYFYHKGEKLDSFMTEPDYFGEETEESNGNPELIAKSFGVKTEDIERYLVAWTEEMYEEEAAAYDSDEFAYCDPWQMADFMAKIGFPYTFSQEI